MNIRRPDFKMLTSISVFKDTGQANTVQTRSHPRAVN